MTVYSHTREEMRERLIRDGWHTWYHPDYWVHPERVSNKRIQNYTDYGLKLEDAFMCDLSQKVKPSILGALLDAVKQLTQKTGDV